MSPVAIPAESACRHLWVRSVAWFNVLECTRCTALRMTHPHAEAATTTTEGNEHG